jgi:hypothetical protein
VLFAPGVKLDITDLFVVGLGFDITGAVLVALGILASAATIAKQTSWKGLSHGQPVERSRNLVDGAFGVGCLVIGFALQAAGYGLELHGSTIGSGSGRLAGAAVVFALAVGAAFAMWWLLRMRLTLRVLVKVELSRPSKQGDEQLVGEWTAEKAQRLVELGQEAGRPVAPEDRVEESPVGYISRVFGVNLPADLPSGEGP